MYPFAGLQSDLDAMQRMRNQIPMETSYKDACNGISHPLIKDFRELLNRCWRRHWCGFKDKFSAADAHFQTT